MSEVCLVVREEGSDWCGTIHGSCADRAIAALSADPVTMEELEVATERFARRTPNRRFYSNLARGHSAEPYDAGLVVIDLVARLVVVDSIYSSAGPEGIVEYHDGRSCTNKRLRYHLADDWLFLSDADHWQSVARERRRERAAQLIPDARQVFYGRPLLEFVGRECFSAFGRRDEIAAAVRVQSDEETTRLSWLGSERSDSPFYDTRKQIHAAWLLTPRDDLGGASPREVGLDRHEHIMSDLQDRCDQWSCRYECPRGLEKSSHAFRYGGFGTHELVAYYHLVRELLWSCWEQLSALAQSPNLEHRPESLVVGDFLTTEVPRLESVREAWLDAIDPEIHGRTHRSIIDRERARVPEIVTRQDAIIDPDCPCCQMMADVPGLTFWNLDGSGMDDDFAFDLDSRTRDEWEEVQQSWEEYFSDSDSEPVERERPGATESPFHDDVSALIGAHRFHEEKIAESPLEIRVFRVGCHLAALVVDLRSGTDPASIPSGDQWHIDQLNRDFGNLREVLQSSDPSLVDALIDPVLRRFAETLDAVATDRPCLGLKCDSLRNDLQELLNTPPPEWDRDSRDAELPF